MGDDVYIAGEEYVYNDSCPMCGRAIAGIGFSKIWKNVAVIDSGGATQYFNALATAMKIFRGITFLPIGKMASRYACPTA